MIQDDHDQRLKTLLKEFFAEFMELFFAVWSKRLDCHRPEWLEQDAFSNPPTGPRRALDLVAKVPILEPPPDIDPNAKEMLAIVHVEIESQDHLGDIPQKMFRYDYILEERHHLPVLPIVVFLDLGYDGLGELSYVQRVFDFDKLHYKFLYVGLKALDGLQYAQGDNWLGVGLSALMRIPRQRLAELTMATLRRLTLAPLTDHQRFLLAECVEAYTPFDEEQQRLYEQLNQAQPAEGYKIVNQTSFEKGIEKGIEKGREEGRALKSRRLLLRMLTKRFGPLPAAVEASINTLSEERADTLIENLSDYHSLEELRLDTTA